MIKLTKVLPIQLTLIDGRKVPINGLNKSNRVDWTPGMNNFAIYMADYPDIVVLDLDTKDHPLLRYTTETYTHETRKGWHCFFRNTYGITRKRQFAKQKFDLLAGNNWIFYDYDDPDVAQYTEFNKLPIAPMPSELYDIVKETASSQGEEMDEAEVQIKPLITVLKKDKYLYDNRSLRWLHNSSELALHILEKMIGYTDNEDILRKVLEFVSNDTQSEEPLISPKQYNANLKRNTDRAKQKANKNKVNWRPLEDYRRVMFGGKDRFADVQNRHLTTQAAVDIMMQPGVDIKLLKYFTRVYQNCQFMPEYGNRKFVGDTYNLFNGWIMPEEGDGHLDYLEFLKVIICDSNELHYNYLIKFIAHMVQYPGVQPRVAIVLYGPTKGTGKDTVHVLLGRLFLEGGYSVFSRHDLFGQFNEPLATTLLGAASELVFGGSHSEDSIMKSLVTDETISINIKHEGSQYVTNRIRLFVTSNSSQPIRATDGERRWFALKPNALKKEDTVFWTRLYNDFNPAHLLYFLKNVDLTGYNTTQVPRSEHLADIVAESMDRIDEDITYWLENLESDKLFKSQELFDTLPSVQTDRYITQRKLMTRIRNIVTEQGFILKKVFRNKTNGYVVIKDAP